MCICLCLRCRYSVSLCNQSHPSVYEWIKKTQKAESQNVCTVEYYSAIYLVKCVTGRKVDKNATYHARAVRFRGNFSIFISYEESWFKINFIISEKDHLGRRRELVGRGRCDQRWLWDVVKFHYENIILKYYFA